MTPWFACAACYGQSDSAMAAGMNWGILSLLVVILCVLGGVAGFFIFLARRAALVSGPTAAAASAIRRPTGETSTRAAPGLEATVARRVLRPIPTRSTRRGRCTRAKSEPRFSV